LTSASQLRIKISRRIPSYIYTKTRKGVKSGPWEMFDDKRELKISRDCPFKLCESRNLQN
jgi:hypothetical protein